MKRLIIIALTLCGCHGVYNITGAHQAKAIAEAEEFVAADVALAGAKVECKKHDSDEDGDITCTVFAPSGERITLECPTRKLIRLVEDHGCKETQRISGRLR